MKKEKIRGAVAFAILMILMPSAASANMIWPSLYIAEGLISWYIILAGVIIETIFIKFILKPDWIRTAIMVLGMNLASAVIGVFAIPVTGLIAELAMSPIPVGTFHISHWIVAYILAVLCNVCIEGLFLKLVFKMTFKNNFKWLTVANAISVALAVIAMTFK